MTVSTLLARQLQTLLPHAALKQYQFSELENIKLWLISDIGSDQPLTETQTDAVWETPPYWSFCWGSGQVVAGWILANRDKIKNRTVIDVGSGSGVVAIAAAIAGAKQVFACDIDKVALQAVTANAHLNSVQINTIDQLEKLPAADWLFAADMLYDPDNYSLLAHFPNYASEVMVADSRVKNFDFPGYTKILEAQSVTQPDLGENEDVKLVRLYCYRQ